MKSRPKANFAKITLMQKWKFEYIACVTPCYFLPFVVAGSLFSSWNYIVILKAAAEAACNPKIAAFVPEINLHEISCKTLNGAEQGASLTAQPSLQLLFSALHQLLEELSCFTCDDDDYR